MKAQAADVDWEQVMFLLITRSGGLCEGRTPRCLASPDGQLHRLPRERVSIQHRRARGMGGGHTGDEHVLANLLVLCGTGVSGCHGWVETAERDLALRRGLWIRHDYRDGVLVAPEEYPLQLASGRRVLLHRDQPLYLNHPNPYGVD